MENQITCKQKVRTELRKEIDALRPLFESYQRGEETTADGESFHEHGLSFDFVSAGTFDGQKEGYFRYQISWGGPSDEFRFYTDAEFSLHRVEYWFLDWFDGAKVILKGKDLELLEQIFDHFKDCGTVEHVFNQAQD